MMNLTRESKITRVVNFSTAATGDVEGDVLDMKGFDSVAFIAAVGTIVATGVPSLKVQQGDESDGTGMSDLEGTSVAADDQDGDKLLIVEVMRPTKRYVRCVVGRLTANIVVDSVVALQSKADKEPVTHDADTVAGYEFHLSPAEGTA